MAKDEDNAPKKDHVPLLAAAEGMVAKVTKAYTAVHDRLLDSSIKVLGINSSDNVDQRDNCVRLRDIPYGDDVRQRLDLYLPSSLAEPFLQKIEAEKMKEVNEKEKEEQDGDENTAKTSTSADDVAERRRLLLRDATFSHFDIRATDNAMTDESKGEETDDGVGDIGCGGVPVAFFVHGGGWDCGNKKYWFDCFGYMGWEFARKGMIGIVPNYRLSPEHKHPCHVDDVCKSIRWMRDNISRFGGDPDGVYLSGHSSGGHTIMLAILDDKYLAQYGLGRNRPGADGASFVRGGIGMSGAYDIEWIHSLPIPQCRIVINQAFGKNKEDWKHANPQYVASVLPGGTRLPPLFLFNAQWDYSMQNHTDRLEKAIQSNDKHCLILRKDYRGLNHIQMIAGGPLSGSEAGRPYQPMLNDMTSFFNQLIHARQVSSGDSSSTRAIGQRSLTIEDFESIELTTCAEHKREQPDVREMEIVL